MAVSKKPKAIKQYLAAALAAINGTGGYENTVCSVNERAGNKAAEVSRGAAEVWLEIKTITNRTDASTRGLRARRAAYKITGQVINPRDAADSDGAMLSLFDDLVRCIETDKTCGGIATSLKWTTMDPVVGDPAVECVIYVEAEYSEARA
jgi:hypothetical protein